MFIREIKIKTATSYHLTLIIMLSTIIEEISASDDMEDREPLYTLGENANLFNHKRKQYGDS